MTLILIGSFGVVAFDFMWYAVLELVSCFKSWNALPPVYPAGSVVRRSITSCPVQRIPFHAYNTTFTNHKALFSLREISPRSKRMRCFHYVCMLLSLILSLGNVRWRVLLMCFATIALMFLSTECVASSISRWLGCKAEYYLLSCSTHSVLRLQRLGWMEDIRRSFFKRWQHKCTALHTTRSLN